MAWIESHQNIKEHKKTYLLMESLGCSKRDAIAIVHMVWWWCLDNALNGHIEVPSIAIKAATEWETDADKLVDGLLASGWLERHPNGGLLVHDWHHYCGALVEKRLERKEFREKKAASVRRPNNSRAASKSRPTVSVSVSESIPKKTFAAVAAVVSISPECLFLSQRLRDGILRNNPTAKTPADLSKWAKVVDLMIRIDKRTPQQVAAVIDFSQFDSFWKQNVLSMDAVRRQFDRLVIKAMANSPKAKDDELMAEMQKWRRQPCTT